MFGWFKRRARFEQEKLIFQNHASLRSNTLYLKQVGDVETEVLLESYEEENQRILKLLESEQKLTPDDLQMLLDINMQMRRLFDHAELNGPEARVRRLMGQPVRARDFDETFKFG